MRIDSMSARQIGAAVLYRHGHFTIDSRHRLETLLQLLFGSATDAGAAFAKEQPPCRLPRRRGCRA